MTIIMYNYNLRTMTYKELLDKLKPMKLGTVAETYGLKNDDILEYHLTRLFSGSGNEASHFTAKDSSSRLCFLCFFWWMRNGGLEFPGINDVKFSKCFFEAKNTVLKSPSNVDVLLVSEDEGTLLYLESKFTEYVRDAKTACTLGESYFKQDELNVLMSSLKESNIIEKGESAVPHRVTSEPYPSGIKQIISHFIGVCKGPAKQELEYGQLNNLWKNANKIYLGSILYQFSDPVFLAYSQCHEQLAKVLNKRTFGDNATKIEVIGKPFTYQEIARTHPLPDKVAQDYLLGKSEE